MEELSYEEIQYYALSLPPKEQGKLLKSISENENIEPTTKIYLAGHLQTQARKGFKEQAKAEGRIPTKRIDPEMSTEGFIYMLENKSTPEASLDYLRYRFNQPEEWVKKVKNREIPDNERRENILHLKLRHSEENITLLQKLLENKYTSFKEIQEPTTYNKQLKHLEKVIKLSDRVDALEDTVDKQGRELEELRAFKIQQELFNSLLVDEISTQREIVESIVDCVIPKYTGSDEERKLLDAQLSLIPETKDKIKYLLSLHISKKDISVILGIPKRTLFRMISKEIK